VKTMSGYRISDEDVDGVVRYMQYFHPEHADRDYCKGLLEAFQSNIITGLRHLALDNPDAIEKMYEEYEAYLKKKS